METVILRPVQTDETEQLWHMQLEAFQGLLAKYRDTETSPGAEAYDKILTRYAQPFTYYYFILVKDEIVGAIRVVDPKDGKTAKRISPLFIMEPYRGRGYAQAAIREAEKRHGSSNWKLDTILEEKGNCRLYEKMGYRQTGDFMPVNERMTLVLYRKD